MTKKTSLQKSTPPRIDLFVKRVNMWSRATRIGMATFVSTILTLMVGYVLHGMLLKDPYSSNLSLFYLLVSGLGIVLYYVGWYLLGAFETDPEHPWIASRASVYYVLVGFAALGLVGLAIVGGLIFAYLL